MGLSAAGLWKAVPAASIVMEKGQSETVTTSVLWQSVLGEIEVSVSSANFTTWFKHTALLESVGGRVIIGVPSIFVKRQFEAKFHPLLIKTLRRNGIKVQTLEYRVQPIEGANPPQPLSVPPPAQGMFRPNSSGLNPRYSFETFVVGSSNDLAYAAARAVAQAPGNKYNPLFIYGGVGLGKTHLIQAVGGAVLATNPHAKVEYATCERFFKEFVAAILAKKTFSSRYRTADVLIVDDMQFIAGKEKAQEEFFHIFNSLHEANKQIIISSDKPPGAIPTLEERLRSRFDGGMTADIQPPDYETRMVILQAKIAQARRTVPADVVEYLATHIQSNIRELEGALIKLFAHCEMRGLVPSLELVEQMISPPAIKGRRINPQIVLEKTARFFNLTVEELISPKRHKQIAEPRQVAMYLMRTELELSFPQIARQVGRSDHTTAIHSVKKVERSLLNNHYLRRSVYELKEKLYV